MEHIEEFGKDKPLMNKLRKDAVAALGCLGIIVAALFLLSYGRKHEIAAILFFGRALDALIAAGIVGNIIVFLLAKISRVNALKAALWTFLITNGLMLFAATVIGRAVDHQQQLGSIFIGYFFSFLFWLSLHWLWSRTRTQFQSPV
jgi:hypothetical protein